MKELNSLKMEFPSRSANESLARASVACLVSQLDPTLAELGDIKTAVSEAVTNCIVHAYPDVIGTVKLRARIFEDGAVEIVVRDGGVGIPDIEKARQPMFTTGGEERSGMGFTIMDSFMDYLRVRSSSERGTVITMKKRLERRV